MQASDLGYSGRQNDFRPDSSLPMGWYEVSDDSYTGSGFDRGHNCPSGDRTASDAINSLTFLMDNVIPQAANNNEQTWANLEDSTRALVEQGDEAYIIMGSYGEGGTGDDGLENTIDNGNVTVPLQYMESGGDFAKRVKRP